MPERIVRIVITGDSTGAVRAFTAATAAAERSQARLKTVGLGMQSVGRMMIGLGAPLALAGGYAVKSAMQFQKSMTMVQTQAHRSAAEVRGFSKDILNLAGPLATSPDTLSAGLYHLASTGLSAKRTMDALKIAAKGAKVGNADLESVTNALNASIVSGIKGSKDFSATMGILNATVGAGDMRMQDLADALSTGVLGPLKVYGLNLKEVGAALAVFGDNNIRGQIAATKLGSAVRIMAAPSKAAAGWFNEIGLDSLQLGKDMHDPNKGLLGALQDLRDHLQGLSQPEQAQILTRMFGGKQSTGILLLINQLDRFRTKLGDVSKGAGSFGSDWKAYTHTFSYQWDSFRHTVEASAIQIGTALMPVIQKFLPELAKAIGKVAKWFDNLPPGVRKLIVQFAAFLLIGGPILILLGKVVLAFSAVKTAILFLGGPIAKAGKWIFGLASKAEAASARVIVANTAMGTSFSRAILPALRLLGILSSIIAAAIAVQEALARITGGPTGGSGVSGASRPMANIEKHTGGGLNSTLNSIRNAPGKFLGKLAKSLSPFASGGIVHGPSGVDRVLARLTAGEGVLTQRGVASIGGASGVAAINRGDGGAAPALQPTPVMVYLDGKVLVRAMTQQVLRRAARGPSSLVGGSLMTGAPGAIDLGATP